MKPRFTIRDLWWLAICLVLTVALWWDIRTHRDPSEVYKEGYDSGFKVAWRTRGIQLGVPKDQWDVVPPHYQNPFDR
jgi:hypothetical protein